MIYLIIFLAVISRFIPHIPNFAPITALAIFSATYLPWKKAFGITFATRFISDVFIGFVSLPMMIAIYASHLVGVLFGVWIKRSSNVIPESFSKVMDSRFRGNDRMRPWIKIIISSFSASAIFFLVTNFAFLYSNYTHNFSGIIEAYVNGLPFLRGTLMGDMFYSLALFGSFEVAKFLVKYKKNHTNYIVSPKS